MTLPVELPLNCPLSRGFNARGDRHEWVAFTGPDASEFYCRWCLMTIRGKEQMADWTRRVWDEWEKHAETVTGI